MIDAINRQDALNLVTTDTPQLLDSDALYMAIEDLPSAELKHRKGRWIFVTDASDNVSHYVCDQCHVRLDSRFVNFCPNCGVKMENANE